MIPTIASRPTVPLPHRRPGWLELGVATLVAVVLYLASGLVTALPAGFPLAPGLVAFAVSALVPGVAFAVALLLRIRRGSSFGLRSVDVRWILAGAGLGLIAVLLTWPVSWLVDPLLPGGDVQQSYRDAAQGGSLMLAATLVLGGVLTPIGEELLFRGVIANVLLRWGTVVGVLGSALVFALAHGINDVTPMAFVIGLITGALMRLTGSIVPGILVHVTYNTTGMIVHALGL
ncbi:CPBP family intramembrane glutamic endopeptidase [Schumannella sp. 10F1B-5-1]|uniref:CPBP family intramembrane glutamic endopeptidase n=1 Tax=Schumannella sp. 10F1B-5-1 TaxID=2590780 RepID=UPI0011306D59|nr:type II CAAX endopeptidase family protein [Schumannella sp. 10F1B-5-1]TPW78414.1 CPBP family intramembrane metalloprotease [Schumannella sp. 10F1B-5-1]